MISIPLVEQNEGIYHRDPRICAHLYPGMGLKLGVFRLFLVIKIMAVCQVCVSLQSRHEDKTPNRCVKIMDALALLLLLLTRSAKT